MSKRANTTLRPPDPNTDYTAFPAEQITANARWWRAHNQNHGPWWFASTPGRFNLLAPHGTLNTASTAQVALREYLGPRLLASREIIATAVVGLSLSGLEIPATKVADFLHPAAATFGILPGDAAGPTGDDYQVTRQWAAALHGAKFGGIVSRSRCGAGANPRCLYLFGRAGEHPIGAVTRTRPAIAELRAMAGYDVLERPHSSALIIDPD